MSHEARHLAQKTFIQKKLMNEKKKKETKFYIYTHETQISPALRSQYMSCQPYVWLNRPTYNMSFTFY